jgi:hypothetical protein
MYEVGLLNNKTKKEFTKVFDSEKTLKRFLIKVQKGKSLTVLHIINNSYLFD